MEPSNHAIREAKTDPKKYRSYRAIFKPQRTDDLKPTAFKFIGREAIFECLWEIEKGRPYAGQWAMGTPRIWSDEQGNVEDHFVWVPSGDLQIIEEVSAAITGRCGD